MKIGQTPEKPVPVSPAQQAAPAKSGQSASTAAAKSGPSAGVAVTVSTMVHTLDKASRGAAADVDVEKVKSVRSAIEQGTYVVNAEAIADKLLANAQELLKRTHS